jgi:hypothetical protein
VKHIEDTASKAIKRAVVEVLSDHVLAVCKNTMA